MKEAEKNITEPTEKELYLKNRPIQMRKKEVAKDLSMGETKLQEFVDKNELRPYRIDGMLMFYTADVFQFVMQYRSPENDNNLGLAI